jgi:hypothetical protein
MLLSIPAATSKMVFIVLHSVGETGDAIHATARRCSPCGGLSGAYDTFAGIAELILVGEDWRRY